MASLPATPDLAVIVVPASGVLAVAEECAARGVLFGDRIVVTDCGEIDSCLRRAGHDQVFPGLK